MPSPPYVIASFYRFVPLIELSRLREKLERSLLENGLKGTVLLAPEGINGSVAGARSGIDAWHSFLCEDRRFEALSWREAPADEIPFRRRKVRIRTEIVSLGVDNVDPGSRVGHYVEPENWNDVVADPSVILIDARNTYEVNAGTFRGAIDPGTESFRELPAFLEECLEGETKSKVAMFCTGGIRCEKATSYLRERGFDQVFHLRGGILAYLERVKAAESLWEGECFVFDERVSVVHQLSRGAYRLCRACRMPLAPSDVSHADFVEGVRCPHCSSVKSEKDRERFRERQRQVELAAQRGMDHFGNESISNGARKHAPSTASCAEGWEPATGDDRFDDTAAAPEAFDET